MKFVSMKYLGLSILLAAALTSPARGGVTVDFDDLPLDPESYENGANLSGEFTSGGIVFDNDYDPTWGSWSGFAYSNKTDTTTPGFGNQFSAITGSGRGPGSDNYGLAAGYIDQSDFDPTDIDDLLDLPTFELPELATIEGMHVTNTTYAAYSMRDGDSFAKRFGGPTGDDPDYFKLYAYGSDADGNALDEVVELYLADYRFADNSLDYILTDWAYLDLTPLAGASRLHFNLESSDVGMFGMNTPAFFALDDIRYTLAAIPEPSSLLLALVGAGGIAAFARRRWSD